MADDRSQPRSGKRFEPNVDEIQHEDDRDGALCHVDHENRHPERRRSRRLQHVHRSDISAPGLTDISLPSPFHKQVGRRKRTEQISDERAEDILGHNALNRFM
jgi:hypothetical protein